MNFSEVVLKRRMIRNFSPEPVDLEIIDRILDLARRGPSAGYTQGQSFVVVTESEKRKARAELCGEKHYLKKGVRSLYFRRSCPCRAMHE